MSNTDPSTNPDALHQSHDVEAGLLYGAYARQPMNLLMTLMVAPAGAALLWSSLPGAPLIAWLVGILCATALGFLGYRLFKSASPVGQEVSRWQRFFVIQAVLRGLAWALGPTLLIYQGIGNMAFMLVSILVCICAVAMVSIAEQRSAMQGFIGAALLPPAAAAFLSGGEFDHLVGAMLVAATIALIKVGRDSAANVRTVIDSQVRLQAVLDASLDAVVGLDGQGRITDWNPRAQLLLGWHKDEVLGKLLNELVWAPQNSGERKSGLARLMKSATSPSVGQRVEMTARHSNGDTIPVEVATTVVNLGNRVLTTAFIADISQRKVTLDRLALFRRVFDASNQCVVISDASGLGVYQNRAHATAMGYADSEIVGKPLVHAVPKAVAQKGWSEVTLAIAKTGAWEGQLPLCRKDGSEFTSVSSIGSIKDEQGAIQFIFNIFADFSDELARRQELKTALDAAERANLAKSDFLSSMSHELRTPMNAILGFGQILEFDETLNVDQRDSVSEILKGGRHLLKLINDVLDLAKIESSSVKLSLEAVGVADVIEESWQVMEPLAVTRKISLHRNFLKSAAVKADRGRLKQVMLNLLSNAINYNHDGGTIEIRAHINAPGRLRIEVIDTGLGIAPERLPVIFEAFNRRGAEHGQIGGTGIGLIIASRLVELMGGVVGVDSQLGVGSTFWLDLPVDHPVVRDAEVGRDDGAVQFDERVHHYSVLCIDDNPVNLKLIGQLLAKRPHIHLITAHTPGLGIQLALGRQPDLILLDINMPGMDGYQVLEVLKTYARTKSIPIIAVTANAVPRAAARGGTTGLADYLTKPLDVGKFLATVDYWLAKGQHDSPDTGSQLPDTASGVQQAP